MSVEVIKFNKKEDFIDKLVDIDFNSVAEDLSSK